MEIGTIDDVAELMANELGARPRVSIIGIARLVDLEDLGDVTYADVERVIKDARDLGFYPQSRAAYLPGAAQGSDVPEYEAAYVEVNLGPPHNYYGVVGMGTCRDVATVDSYTLEGDDPHGVLLSDVEAVAADLLTLAYVRALHIEYRGRIDLYIDLVEGDVGASPGLWCIDEATGEMTRTGRVVSDFAPVRFSAHTMSSFETLLEDVRAASREIAHRFGVERPELIPEEGHGGVELEIDDRQAALSQRGIRPLHEI